MRIGPAGRTSGDLPCADLPTLDLVVTPRWLRERRRAGRRAARPDALAAEWTRPVFDRVGRIDELFEELQSVVALLRDPGRARTAHELMVEQGVRPFDAEAWSRRESGLSAADWAELRAAMWGTGR